MQPEQHVGSRRLATGAWPVLAAALLLSGGCGDELSPGAEIGQLPFALSSTVRVAASDSAAAAKATADQVCDGKDDQKEIQAAISAVAAGGQVVLEAGTYQLSSSVVLKNNITLKGAGQTQTILKFSSGRAEISGVQQVTVSDFRLLGTGAIYVKNAKHISVERIYAYDISNVQWGAFQWRADNYVTEDLQFVDCTADYIARHGFVGDGTEGGTGLVKGLKLVRCKALSCGLHNRLPQEYGTWVTGFDVTEHVDVEDVLIDSCVADNNWESGFHIEYFPKKTKVKFVNCLSTRNGRVKYQTSSDEKVWMAGYTVSGDVTLVNCRSENNVKGLFLNTGYWRNGFFDIPGTPTIINFFDRGSRLGLEMVPARRGLIKDSVFLESETYGIQAYKSWGVQFENCDLVNPVGVNKVYINDMADPAGTQDYSGVDIIFDPNYQPPAHNPPTDPPVVPNDPLVIPGTVDAIRYDEGGEGVAYHDTTPGNEEGQLRSDDVDIVVRPWQSGYLIGYVADGEWLRYTVEVKQPGHYDVEFLVYCMSAGRKLTLEVDGQPAAMVQVPAGGDWAKPLRPTAKLSFAKAGTHQLVLRLNGGDMNLGAMSFAPGSAPVTPADAGPVDPGRADAGPAPAPGDGSMGGDLTRGQTEADDGLGGGCAAAGRGAPSGWGLGLLLLVLTVLLRRRRARSSFGAVLFLSCCVVACGCGQAGVHQSPPRRDARPDWYLFAPDLQPPDIAISPADLPVTGDTVMPMDGYAGDIGKWVTLQKGTFTMGSSSSEACRNADETAHQVTLTHDFEIMAHEVTQGLYQTTMGTNPSFFSACGADCPVETVSWHMAAAYCNELSKKKNRLPCYVCSGTGKSTVCGETAAAGGGKIYSCPGYRLPTEAEWEYAYRAGTTLAYYGGTADSSTCTECQHRIEHLDEVSWYCANSGGYTQKIMQKKANPWGLYDMAGNVSEWCNDLHVPDLGTSAATDPWGAPSGTDRIFHGGSKGDFPRILRAAQRNDVAAETRGNAIGFRCARTLSP